MKIHRTKPNSTSQHDTPHAGRDGSPIDPFRNEFNLALPDLRNYTEYDHRLATTTITTDSRTPSRSPTHSPSPPHPAESSHAADDDTWSQHPHSRAAGIFTSASTTQERVTQASIVGAGTTIVAHLPALLKANNRAQREQAFGHMLLAASTNGSVIGVSCSVLELLTRMKGVVIDMLGMPRALIGRLGPFCISGLQTATSGPLTALNLITTATLTTAEAASHLLVSIYKLIRYGRRAARIELDAAINAFAPSHIIDNGIRAAALLLADTLCRSAVACAGPVAGPVLGFILYGLASGMAWQRAEEGIRRCVEQDPSEMLKSSLPSPEGTEVRWIWKPIVNAANPAQYEGVIQPHDKTPLSLDCYICSRLVYKPMRHRNLGGDLACAHCLSRWIAANARDPLTNTPASYPENYKTDRNATKCAREVAERLNLVPCFVRADGYYTEIVLQPM